MKPDGIRGGGASYPGKPSCPVVDVATDGSKPTRRGDPEARRGRGWQILREVLVKVYEPGRLCKAWQQVRKNAGAAGIDQMTIAYLEQELGLLVNREKSQVAPIKEVSFLGFQILRGKIRVSTQAQVRFKDRVRELTRRNNPLSMYQG